MTESAALARRLGLKLHTHLAESVEEEAYCLELYGCTPVEYLAELGWLAGDVWCAHCVHLSEADVAAFARPASVSRTARPRTCASVPASLPCASSSTPASASVSASTARPRTSAAISRSRSSRHCSSRAVAAARRAMTAREALRLATRGGAAVLGRDDIGSLEPGKRADIAVWRTDGLELGGA